MDGNDLMKWALRLGVSVPTLARAGIKTSNTNAENSDALHELSEVHARKKTKHFLIETTAFDMATELEENGEVNDD